MYEVFFYKLENYRKQLEMQTINKFANKEIPSYEKPIILVLKYEDLMMSKSTGVASYKINSFGGLVVYFSSKFQWEKSKPSCDV